MAHEQIKNAIDTLQAGHKLRIRCGGGTIALLERDQSNGIVYFAVLVDYSVRASFKANYTNVRVTEGLDTTMVITDSGTLFLEQVYLIEEAVA